MGTEMVPRHLLDSSNRTLNKLQKQLDDLEVESRRDVEEATVALQNQLRVVQNQQRMAEDQLHRSMQRERDLRGQVSNADVTGILGRLRSDLEASNEDNHDLRAEIELLRSRLREHDELKRQMDALQLEMDAMDSAHISNLRAAQAETEKMRQALAASEKKLVRTVEEREMEFKAIVNDKESILRTQQEELQELHDALTESHDILAATDQVSNQYGSRVSELEQELTQTRQHSQESAKHGRDMERRCRALEEQIEALESDLCNEQDLVARLTQTVTAYENELVTIKGQSASSQDELAKKGFSLAAEVEDLQCKLSEAQAGRKNSEADLSETKDRCRRELSEAETENKQLRKLLRDERDLVEKTMREHSATVADQLETQQRIEHAALRREEALQRRLQQAEEENEGLRCSSVPEEHIKRMQQQIVMEKEELQARLDRSTEELRSAERALSLSREGLQLDLHKAQHDAALAAQQIHPLQQQLQEALDDAAQAKRLSSSLQDQVRLLTGGGEGAAGGDVKLSKVAETALRSLTEEHRRCPADLAALSGSKGAAGVNAWLASQQRTALGIVLRETTVEAVVPGSPAAMSGRIAPRDELLMVDGRRVTAASAMAALRGNDAQGTVVAIVLRSGEGGEAVEVELVREGIGRVREQQALAEEVQQLEDQAEQAGRAAQWTVLHDRLRCLAEARRSMLRGHLGDLCRLGAWAQGLKESAESLAVKGRQGVMTVDACHQRVHALQGKLEEELRADLGRAAEEGGAGAVDELHRTIQQLEGAVRLQQEEMRGLQMLAQDAEEREVKEAAARLGAEERARTLEGVQGELSQRMAALNAQTGEALAEVKQLPSVVALRLGGLALAKGREREAKAAVEQELQAELVVCLQAAAPSVQVLCSYGDEELVLLVKLAAPASASPSPSQMLSGRDGRALAEDLMSQVEDAGSVLRSGGLGKTVRGAQMHGPITELTARSLRLALAGRDREWNWVEQELQAVRGRVEADVSHMSRETEVMAVETEARVAAAREGGRAEGRGAMEAEMEARLEEQAEDLQRQWHSEVADGKRREAAMGQELAAVQEACAHKDANIRALQGLLTDLQGRLEMVEQELNAAEESQRRADHERARSAEFAQQMRKLVGPEIRGCLTTLDNVESELGFFHAYQMRALSIAGCMGGLDPSAGASTTTPADAAQSKDVVDRDLRSLREQLEAVLALTGRAVARGTSSIHSSRGPSPPPGAGRRGSEALDLSRTTSLWTNSGGKRGSGRGRPLDGSAGGVRGDGSAVNEMRGWRQGGAWRDDGLRSAHKPAGGDNGGGSTLPQPQLVSGKGFGSSPPARAIPAVPSSPADGTNPVRPPSPPPPMRSRQSPPPLGSAESFHLRHASPHLARMPRVLTPVGKHPFALRVAVLEASRLPARLADTYLCACLSVLPPPADDTLFERLLVPQHRTLPACGRGSVVWDGARELSFSRARILFVQHSQSEMAMPGSHHEPRHVDFSGKGDRRRGVEAAATEELRGQSLLLLVSLHTAGADAGSNATVARCLVNVHSGMDAEQWHGLEEQDGPALVDEAGQQGRLKMRIVYQASRSQTSLTAPDEGEDDAEHAQDSSPNPRPGVGNGADSQGGQ